MLIKVDINYIMIIEEAYSEIKALIDKEERYVSDDRISIIYNKLSHRENTVSIILILIDKDSQMLFHSLI